MFQSLWNVATAFCAHETASKNSVTAFHFGHHFDSATDHQSGSSLLTAESKNLKNTVIHSPSIFMDHHDHLPTCLHIVMAEIGQHAREPFRSGYLTRSVYDWANSYQSPHLSGLNPPPVLTPL
ncbi:cation efflux protein, CzcI-like [Acinetobacter guerrae]|uniref:cation efflux protein, CzcI-like n=1 Tax=Acinetobacter guerrae TaxID=1843371 RepID=UPI00128E3F7C|nr:cation efflux protein, CzcI-like [Acinetobacter guerrae]MPW45617.1 cation transporter [Acinetobacter guerrae]